MTSGASHLSVGPHLLSQASFLAGSLLAGKTHGPADKRRARRAMGSNLPDSPSFAFPAVAVSNDMLFKLPVDIAIGQNRKHQRGGNRNDGNQSAQP